MNTSPRPVLIGGSGGSGTTLVADLLGRCDPVTPVYETEIVPSIALALYQGSASVPTDQRLAEVQRRMDRWLASGTEGRPHTKAPHEVYHHGPQHIRFSRDDALAATAVLVAAIRAGTPEDAAFREFVHALMAAHCRAVGKPAWVSKVPDYALVIPLLHALMPDTTYVDCVRDPRAVAASVLARPWGPRKPRKAGEYWAARVRSGRRFGEEHPGAYRLVRYERLVEDPVPELGPVLEAMGYAVDDAVAARWRASVDPSRAEAWRRVLSPKEARQVVHGAGAEGHVFMASRS